MRKTFPARAGVSLDGSKDTVFILLDARWESKTRRVSWVKFNVGVTARSTLTTNGEAALNRAEKAV